MNTRNPYQLGYRLQTDRRGFTLMEVLLVLVILVILASLAVTTYRGVQSRALKDAAKFESGRDLQANRSVPASHAFVSQQPQRSDHEAGRRQIGG